MRSGTVVGMGVRNGGRSLLDTVLDRAVVPGYTRVGYRLRQPGWADIGPAPDALRGRTALVTGGNRGIGKAIAAGLTQLGARHCQLEQSEGDFRRFASAIHQVACDV